MRRTVDLLTIGQDQAGVVSRRQLRDAGIGDKVVRRHLAAGLLVACGRDVFRVVGVPPSWEQRVWAALLTAPAASVVSRRSAARLHQIGRFAGDHIDVVEVGHASNRVTGGTAHRSLLVPAHHRTTVRGIAVTTLDRTVFDLAALASRKRRRRGLPWLPEHQVARALDDGIAKGVHPARFAAVLHELGGRGRGGTVLMRSLLSTRGEGYVATESELEDLLHTVLQRYGLPLPVRQRNLGGHDDRTGRVDFVYADLGIVIEADGRKNHTALLDREGDAWRDLELAAAGFRVIRVTWTQLTTDPGRFVRALRLLLARPRSSS